MGTSAAEEPACLQVQVLLSILSQEGQAWA